MVEITLAEKEERNYFKDLIFLHGIDFSNEENVNKMKDLFESLGFPVKNSEQEDENKSVVFQLDNCQDDKGLYF